MSEWVHITGSQPERPKDTETSANRVYLRRNIIAVDDIDADSAEQDEENHTAVPGWEYDEMILSKAEYNSALAILANPFYTANADDLETRITNIETFIATSTES